MDQFPPHLAATVTGAELAAIDWSATPIGDYGDWPVSLKSTLALMLACPTPMFLAWGPDLRCFFNDAYRPMLGYRLPTALGRPFREVWASIWDDIGPLVTATLAGESRTMTDMPLDLSREGVAEAGWWTFTYSPAHDDAGRIAGLFCVTGETTARVLAERARDAANEQLASLNRDLETRVRERTAERNLLATIFEETDTFVHVIDTDYRWMGLNRAGADEFERAFGRRPKAGDHLLDLLAHLPDQREEVEAIWTRALAGENFTTIAELGDPAAGGERRSYEMRFRTLRNEHDEPRGAFQLVTDVTDRLRATAELEQAREAMRQAQKLEAIGQLTGGVAHDFNNLLTVIRGSTELLRRADLAEERRRRYVDAIADSADRATRLTSQLLAFSRRQSLRPELFDLGQSVTDLRDIVVTLAGSRIEVEVVVPKEPVLVLADRSQLDTAIINMAVNARDAMPGSGKLTIAVGAVSGIPAIRGHAPAVGEFVTVTVGDTGEGIPADRLEQIFEPFFTTKAVGAGTGLGLSQAIGLAKQSGGTINVESAVGQGSSFTLYLPRTDAMPIVAEPTEEVVERSGEGACVLVVEDNADVGEFATAALRELGYRSTLASDAEQALAALSRNPHGFQVIFTDVVMPGMSGVELGEVVRRRYPGVPLVLTSGYSHVLAQNDQHGFELLHKPYSIEQLSRVLGKAIAWRGAGRLSS
ncbi:PAS domain-containing protein [Sphingomonas sp. 1P08PE]|uniref:PAS domain-containing protein n=1 Tax=Sphingomonas sp. 1P08PE TaxID=554122 RepID=UPI0039A327E2